MVVSATRLGETGKQTKPHYLLNNAIIGNAVQRYKDSLQQRGAAHYRYTCQTELYHIGHEAN